MSRAVIGPCKTCGKETDRQNGFCSRACYMASNPTTQPTPKTRPRKANKYAEQAAESRERYRRERVCESKKPFETREVAEATGNKAYVCQYCGLWHTSSKFNRLVAKVKRKAANNSQRRK